MAVVWQNSFDGVPLSLVSEDLDGPGTSGEWGDPIVDLRNSADVSHVRYGDRAFHGRSSLMLGADDAFSGNHGDVQLTEALTEWSVSFYLYRTGDGWFRFLQDGRVNVTDLYLDFDSGAHFVGWDELDSEATDQMPDRWVRIEASQGADEVTWRFWWTDPDSTGTPDYEFTVEASATGGYLFVQGGGSEADHPPAYIDSVQVGEGEWIGPWPAEDHEGTAEVPSHGAASAQGIKNTGTPVHLVSEAGLTVTGGRSGSSTVSLAAETDLAAHGHKTTTGALGLSAVGHVQAEGTGVPVTTARLQARARLRAAGRKSAEATGEVRGQGAASAQGYAPPHHTGTADVAASATVSAPGTKHATGRGGVVAETSVSGQGHQPEHHTGTAHVGAHTDVRGEGTGLVEGEGMARLQATAAVRAAGHKTIAGTARLSGRAELHTRVPPPMVMGQITIRLELGINGRWVDVTEDVPGQQIQITRGRQDEASQADPAEMTLELDNPHGDYTPRRPQSPHYPHIRQGTPIRLAVWWQDEWHVRFAGEVAEWSPTWPYGDLSVPERGLPGEARVSVTASGVLRRLGQGQAELGSALRRFIMSHRPFVYWPLDVGEDSRQADPVLGAGPMRSQSAQGAFYGDQPSWGRGELAPWLEQVVLFDTDRGRITSRAPLHSGNGWVADWVRSGAGGIDTVTLRDVGAGTDESPRVQWHIGTDPTVQPREALVSVSVFSDSGASTTMLARLPNAVMFARGVHHMRFSVVPTSGGGSAWALLVDGAELASGTQTGISYAPIGGSTTEWWVPDDGISEEHAMGHLAFYDADQAPEAGAVVRAVNGYRGETSGRRIERLCSEEGIGFVAHGDMDDCQILGPQYPKPVLELLQEAAEADDGLLYEAREAIAIAYRSGRSQYNQGVTT